ncbi:MAG: hypothetical protein E7514_03035 [Ruminococcaceae bacterium]|nr:hypothetical protein [Oscillospiraceae bacterium]
MKALGRIYVDVVLCHSADGNKRPITVKWTDGSMYNIDAVGDVKQTVSPSGGCGLRYPVVIGGKQTYLFEDLYESKWFVEPKAKKRRHAD